MLLQTLNKSLLLQIRDAIFQFSSSSERQAHKFFYSVEISKVAEHGIYLPWIQHGNFQHILAQWKGGFHVLFLHSHFCRVLLNLLQCPLQRSSRCHRLVRSMHNPLGNSVEMFLTTLREIMIPANRFQHWYNSYSH